MIQTSLSLVVLTIFALVAGAIYLARRGGKRRQVVLMLVLAGVMAINVAIWTIPGGDGKAPVHRQAQ